MKTQAPTKAAPLEMSRDEFRALGYRLVDQIADFFESLPQCPVNPGESPMTIRGMLGEGSLPEHGTPPESLLEKTADLLLNHSLFNGHPRFWGYITSSAAPIGALGDLLAAAINPNVGVWELSPMASEIEAQTIRWIAQMIGYPSDCGGLLVSGGNMANFVGFLTARKVKADWDIRTVGMSKQHPQLRVYASSETHTWIQKATDLFGLGTDAIRWIPTDTDLRMDTTALDEQIRADFERGDKPFLVVGTAGSVSTGVVDALLELKRICREHDLWFHVDGAYGGFAAVLPDASPDLKGLSEADSVAVDPHKWLYSPLEAGCALVRNPEHLRETFSYHPPYYKFLDSVAEEPPIDYHDYGPQNSRGLRALKVWLSFQQAGQSGYVQMISGNIQLAQVLYQLVLAHPELQATTCNLSITTFRYVPTDLTPGETNVEAYLNQLNTELLTRLQNSGEAYLSHTVIEGRFVLRVCIVNFRTKLVDIEALPDIITRIGREVDTTERPAELVKAGPP